MFRTSVKLALIFVYLVILAGSVVRMTGSGMGCPDWPKCFGHLIPPTERAQLEWHPHEEFKKGQVIIKEESLKVAKSDFTTSETYEPQNWADYTKHDYAEFNAFHTWVEFVNRLFGMLSGIFVLIMALVGTYCALFKFKNYKKRTIALGWLSVLLIGLEAWLGAVVVYSLLQPFKITLHMGMSIVIVAVLIYLLQMARKKPPRVKFDKQFRNLMVLALALTLVQIIMGTRVRQFVDEQVKDLGQFTQGKWLAAPHFMFYVHRSFSIIILLLNGYLWWKNAQMNLGHRLMNGVLLLIVLEIFVGIGLYYFDFPFLSQPLHLLIALLLFAAQFYIVLQAKKSQARLITA